jgi:hypothetical protein
MFTIQSSLIISSIFALVILFMFSSVATEKVIELFKKIKDF